MAVVHKYYQIEQDRNIANLPQINYLNNYIHKNIPTDTGIQLYVEGKNEIEYPDLIERPLFLVSDEFKKVFRIYQKEYTYHAVVLTERIRQSQKVYWHVELPERDCLSDKTEYYKNSTFKKIVIDEEKAEESSFFKITNYMHTFYIVRLDFAESLLRRGINGFSLKGIEHE